jgi:hypothetical protein
MDQSLFPHFDLQLKILEFFGLWIPQDSSRALKFRGFLSHQILILISLVMPFLNYLYFEVKFVNICVHVALFLGANLKIPILLFRMKSFMQLFEEMKELIEFAKPEKNLDRLKLKKHAKIMERVTKIILGIIIGNNVMELMASLREHSVPFKSWVPGDHQLVVDYAYPIAILQVMLMTTVQCFTIILEILPNSFIGVASILLTELLERMERLSEVTLDEEADYNELKKCVQLHRRISEFVTKIQAQFSALLFIQGFLSSAFLCFFIIYISKVSFHLNHVEFQFAFPSRSIRLSF